MIPPPPRSTLFPYTTLFRSTLNNRAICSSKAHGFQLEHYLHQHQRTFWSPRTAARRSEEDTSELQSQSNLVCRLLLEKKKKKTKLQVFHAPQIRKTNQHDTSLSCRRLCSFYLYLYVT